MKTIILVRHAKSSWKNLDLDDFDRPLNKRGKKNAPFMGRKLKERRILPDLVLSSPAKRARKTATVIAKTIGYPKKKIVYDDGIYHATARYLFRLTKGLSKKVDDVMLVGHNPGFNDFTNMLQAAYRIENIPTAGICSIQFDVKQWKQLKKGAGELVFFDFPKRLQEGLV